MGGQGHDDGPRRQGAPPGREQPQQRAHYGGHGHQHRALTQLLAPHVLRGHPLQVHGPGLALHGRGQLGRQALRRRAPGDLKNYPDQFRVDYALSREQQNKDGGKMYIQDKVEEYGEEVFQLLQEGAIIYFCGLKGMMPGINDMLERVATSKGIEWDTFQKDLKKNGQYHVEVY